MDRNAYSRGDTCCRARTLSSSRSATFPPLSCVPRNRKEAPHRRGEFLSVKLPSVLGPGGHSADLFRILLWLGGREWANEAGPNGATPKSETPPARRSLYKFHESFEPYIFSLSSRFARHVLLKYDNFTRAGRPPPSPPPSLLLPLASPPLGAPFFFFHGPPRCTPARSSSAFVYSGPSLEPDARFLRTRVVIFFTGSIYHSRYNCMLISLITCEILSHRR